MALVFLIGPQAVGKMTVGQELEKLTGFKLFHNHIVIEAVTPFFSYGTREGRQLVGRIRQAFFDAFLEHPDQSYILTFVWAFGVPGEREYVEDIAAQFAAKGHAIHWVELEAPLDIRLQRNRSDNRLTHKPSKRDLVSSEKRVIDTEKTYRFNSEPGELAYPSYLRIDTTHLSAAQTAERIQGHIAEQA